MNTPRATRVGQQRSSALTRQSAEAQAQSRGRDFARAPEAVPRLQHRLPELRLHTDAEGARVAEQEHARAVTIGTDVYFNRGEFAPETTEGRELLGHELTHVEQHVQGRAPGGPQQDPKLDTKRGLGSSPPDVEFARAEGQANEQEHVLFPYDSDRLSPNEEKKIQSWAKSQFIPVVVELHGYASHEGKDEYNVNLSAHRALTVKYAIEAALPLGSRVELIAHGETGGFDTPDANRRVGMSSRMKPLELSMPGLGQGGFGKAPSLGLGGQAPYLQPPTFSPVTPPTLFPPPITQPPGSGALDLYRLPSDVPEPYWPNLAQPFTDRGLTMGEGDMDVMRGMATQNLGLLNLTEGAYRGPYNWARRNFKFLDLEPLELAKPKWAASLAGSAAGTQLSFDNPTALEAGNRDAARFGLPEPTMIPLPGMSFDLQGDAVKRSQEAAKRREEEARKKKGSN